MKIKTGKNDLLQPYLSSRHLLDDHNILNDTKNRAETTYLNIFLSLKSGSFWVRGLGYKFLEIMQKSKFIMALITLSVDRFSKFSGPIRKN